MLSIGRPRRQMMTQQQRHNKRQRATPQQLAFLRKMFCEDPKPDQRKREQIGRKIDMTPRSVQIWFQNNRAKTKNLEERISKRIPTVTTSCDGPISRVSLNMNDSTATPGFPITPSLYMQPVSSFSTPVLPIHSQREFLSDELTHGFMPTSAATPCQELESPLTTSSVTSPPGPGPKFSSSGWVLLSCTDVEIGNWSHMKSFDYKNSDLTVRFNPMMSSIQYLITGNQTSYSIDAEISCYDPIQLRRDLEVESLAHFEIKISGQVHFSVCGPEDLQCHPCGDFTNGELSRERIHRLKGPYNQLEQELTRIGLYSSPIESNPVFDSPSFQEPVFGKVQQQNDYMSLAAATPSPAVSPLSTTPYDDNYPLQSMVSWQIARPTSDSPQISSSIDPSSPEDAIFDILGGSSDSSNQFWPSTPSTAGHTTQDDIISGRCPSVSDRNSKQQSTMLDVDPALWLL